MALEQIEQLSVLRLRLPELLYWPLITIWLSKGVCQLKKGS